MITLSTHLIAVLIVILLLLIQINVNRTDRKHYRAEISELYILLNSRTVGESSDAIKVLRSEPDKPTTVRERIYTAKLDLQADADREDIFPVST